MKIRGDTQMAEIIDSHERRLRIMELAMVGVVFYKCLRAFAAARRGK